MDIEESKPYVSDDVSQMQCLGKPSTARFVMTDISWPAHNGDAEICLWKDDKYAAVSITIDDNSTPDHEWWLEQCTQHNFPVTWFVITKGVTATELDATYNGSWEKWRALRAAGHSVQSHTINHHTDISVLEEAVARQEYGGSRFIFEENMAVELGVIDDSYQCLTVAYPCGKAQARIAQEYFIACRGTTGTPNEANLINYSDTHSCGLSVDSIHAILGEKAPNIKWMNNPRYQRGWISPIFHLVAWGKTPEVQAASVKKAEEQIAYMIKRRDRLWIDTFVNVVKYGQERDSAILKTIESTDEKIILSLGDSMRDDIFKFPLTLKVKVPSAWTQVIVSQGEQLTEPPVYIHEGGSYVLLNAIPDAGSVTLSRAGD